VAPVPTRPSPVTPRAVAACVALALAACAPAPVDPAATGAAAPAAGALLKNRLADAPSAYLRRAATQPIPWQTWGDDALVRARALNRPLFVSVGYGACHWCEVMSETTLTDPQVIAALRDNFVPVKVDRDLNPDLDAAWQPLLVSLTGQGGWPLHVWLTPSGEPFFATGYQPAHAQDGQPGFLDLLKAQAAQWRADPARVQTQARRRATLLAAAARAEPTRADAPADTALRAQTDAAMRVYDPVAGGRRGAPKQPFDLPLEAMLDDPRPEVTRAALHTLASFATGALRDPVGGGFHRYCVDAAWRVPHFEKLAADNARLATLYLRAAALAPPQQAPAMRALAAETLDFLRASMWLEGDRVAVALPARAYTADGQRLEGGAAALTAEQVQALQARVPGLALTALGLEAPALPDGRFVPRAVGPMDAPATQALSLLRADRARLRSPEPDALAVLGDQARVLSALTHARWLATPPEAARWSASARALSARLHSDLSQAAAWPRAWGQGQPAGEATEADVLAVGHAALDVFEREADPASLALAQRALERLARAAPDATETRALGRRLRAHTDAPLDRAAAQVLIVAASLDAPEASALLAEAAPSVAPAWTRMAATPAQLEALATAAPWTQGKGLRDARPTAWVCAAGRCLPPMHDAPALRDALRADRRLSPAAEIAD